MCIYIYYTYVYIYREREPFLIALKGPGFEGAILFDCRGSSSQSPGTNTATQNPSTTIYYLHHRTSISKPKP